MSWVFETLSFYMGFTFVKYALVAGVFIALSSSLLGVTLVLKRFSFIGDSLSHVAFGAMGVAMVMSLTNRMVLILPVTILSAIFLLRSGGKSGIKGDAALAMLSVAALAMGYLVINVFGRSANVSGDVCSTLFGSTSILTLRASEVWLTAALSALVVLVFSFFYNKIFAITFDEPFTRATGVNARAYETLIAVVTATVIVLAMNLVGSLLTSALIVFPALSAMRVFRSFRRVVLCSAALSVFCALLGILVSILASTPVGSTIVAADIAAFLGFYAAGRLKGGNA